MTRYGFLIDTYRTERLKILTVWSAVPENRMETRVEPRARTPREQMVHQCVSEDTWMRTMLGIEVGSEALPADETKLGFLEHYARVSAERLAALELRSDAWFEGETDFFDVRRTRAWVLTRRLTHSAHHRGQLTLCLRGWGESLYSTYGPTADTGGLFQRGAPVIYRYPDVEALLRAERTGGGGPPLPGPGLHPPTERP